MSFHSGEIAVQTQARVREEAKQLLKVISRIIKPATQEFLRTQQLAIASTIDVNGRVWADLLTGKPGFVKVLSEQTLEIDAMWRANHSEVSILHKNLLFNSQLGLLVIDLVSRRRLRLNGKAEINPEGKINLEIQQAFFNCPKYIQIRHLEKNIALSSKPTEIFTRNSLSEIDKHWITQADTFFIASSHPEIGADASHRGGFPGFVQVVNNNKLMFPDYAGNNMFQTLGNLLINPNAGLLFVDFEQGNTLQLTGKAQVIWDAELLNAFAGAQRLVELEVEQVVFMRNATNLSWRFGEYSPVNPG